MREVFATNENIAERVATRHATYLEELRPAITRYENGGIWVDTEHPAFVALVKRYRTEATWGPGLWAVLHSKGDPSPDWLRTFTREIPCNACRSHFEAICRATPPDYGALWFAWTVWAHNQVNAVLGKRPWTIAEARQSYPRRCMDETDEAMLVKRPTSALPRV